jgi:hypothetical protein
MNSLRDGWRRSWLYQYFAIMDRTDRATALVALAMLLAFVISFAAIARSREPAETSAPALNAPPFVLQFAAAAGTRAIARATRS